DPLIPKGTVGKITGGFAGALYQGKDDAEKFFADKAETVARWTRGWFGDEVGVQDNASAGSGANSLHETREGDFGALSRTHEDHFQAPGGRPHLPGLSDEAVVAPLIFKEHLPYQGGGSIWKESELQLRALFKEEFSTLGGEDAQATEALKTWNIDRLKDTIVKNPVNYGLPEGVNVDRLTLEQLGNVKWGKAVHDTFGEGGLTSGLSPDKLVKIAGNNETLRNFFNTHPNAPRTSENYEAILRGEGETLLDSRKVPSEYDAGDPLPQGVFPPDYDTVGDSQRESILPGPPAPHVEALRSLRAPGGDGAWNDEVLVENAPSPEWAGFPPQEPVKVWDVTKSYDPDVHGPTSQYTGKEEIPPLHGGHDPIFEARHPEGLGGSSPDMPPPPVLEGMKIKIPLGAEIESEIEKVFEKDPGYMAQARTFLEDYLEKYKTEHNGATVSEDKLVAFVSEMDEIDEWVMNALFKEGGDSPENRLTLMKTILGYVPLTPKEAGLLSAGTSSEIKKFDIKFDLNRWSLREIRRLEDFIEDGPFGEHLKKVLTAGNAVSYETRRDQLVAHLVGQQRDFVDRTQIPLPGVGAENREYSAELPASPSRYSFDPQPKKVNK
ncbi:MAG TPA: hypothetical protein VJG29_02245, partial [Candidatus Paceibacterota bacterium]